MGIGRSIYEKTLIGKTGSTQVYGSNKPELEAFQEVVRELEQLESDGLITITNRHPESESGFRYIDLVLFKRLA